MSLPPGFLEELRSRVSISSVVGRKVIWDMRKSNQGKGDMWAPCPFHQEKSASFHVDDRKGYYYCFGCQAKGDAITFLREAENMDFMEAVEVLATEAGMTMPAFSPQAKETRDRRAELADVMEEAVKHFRLSLSQKIGTNARAYLDGRGMAMATRDRFDIGFAPDARTGLYDHLRAKGIAEDLIIDAGLAAKPEDGGAPYDRFRDRIIFPIRDGRGRCIALGGRAMSANAKAKYLNSPETELFDKGRSLYNHGPAREASTKASALIVAEGYMDVIALVTAGFGATVAPLGTAITSDQIRLMWRMHDEPIIALDGDKAGLAAALRTIDVALPLLEAGKSLRFAVLPDGLDPDDLIKAQGAAGMQAVLDGALPMVDLLWRRETDGKVFDSPERRAALDRDLRTVIKKINDPAIRRHYGAALKKKLDDLYGEQGLSLGATAGFQGGFDAGAAPDGYDPAYGQSDPRDYDQGYQPDYHPGAGDHHGDAAHYSRPNARSPKGPQKSGGFGAKSRKSWGGKRAPWEVDDTMPSASTTQSYLVQNGPAAEVHLREAVILATLIVTPEVIAQFHSDLEDLSFSAAPHRLIRDALLRYEDMEAGELRRELMNDVGPRALEALFALPTIKIAPSVRRAGDLDVARNCLEEEISKLVAHQGLQRELKEARQDLTEITEEDEGVTWRLTQAVEARNRAQASERADTTEYDTARNGVRVSRSERNALDELLKEIQARSQKST